jgi:integrase
MSAGGEMVLFDGNGRRKYLCAGEVPRFLKMARAADAETYLFCSLLAYTGCRISEALALMPVHLDPETSRVVFRTLKRRRVVHRAVPVPSELMTALCRSAKSQPDAPIWRWSRQTAWRRVKAVMDAADITGPQAMPKGLRHGFGVANAEENVPMATTQKWLGHAKLETTAIYQQAVGREEAAFARRLWVRWKAVSNQRSIPVSSKSGATS